jgi:HK97 family phage prohead protease
MPHSASTFKFFVPFNRAYIDKSTNKMMVEGLASTTEVDLTGEKMAESAIKSMAASNLPLPFRSEHRSDWDAQLGSITELSATPDHQLLMKAELDADHPNAHFLFGKLQTGSQLGLSIGGQVNDWGWENDPEIGRSIRTYKDIALKEVSVTSHPAVQSTFLSAISKSLNTEEPSMPQPTDATTAVAEQAPPAPTEAVNLEPADEVIVGQTPAEPSGTEVANPVDGTPDAVNAEGLPLNPDQAAPADQPAAAPETPATLGNHASKEQVAAQEEAHPDENPDEKTDEKTEDTANTGAAGHQEAASTEATQPDAAQTEKAVTKAEYLGEFIEAQATASLIADISDNLSWQVWNVIADDEMDSATQVKTVDAMLGEFHDIVLKVATALIEQDASSDAAEMGKTLQAKRTELTKSLATANDELAAIKKQFAERSIALAEKEAEVTTSKTIVEATKAELETTKKALTEAKSQAETTSARKHYAVASKFDLALDLPNPVDKHATDKAFASFFIGK